MIPKECKRLAEVDFPIAIVGKYSIRDKKLFRNNPQAFHQWWARRPLAACRAMLLGLLLPDPCDEHCPRDFKEKARILLPGVQGKVGPKDEDLRKSLLKFIGDFANWDLSANQSWLDISRGLVKAAVNQAKATCPHCNAVLSTERMRQQLMVQNGGANVLFDEYGNRIGGQSD